MEIRRYTATDQPVWDDFVRSSRNGTFIFERAYMDYHSDRFADFSLMYLTPKGQLLALLPACLLTDAAVGKVLSSHAGLTFGGFIFSSDTQMADVLELFSSTLSFLREQGFSRWSYKKVPYIYHRQPSDDDEYALWLNGAQLTVCNISTTIDLRSTLQLAVSQNHCRQERKARQSGISVAETHDLREFWAIVCANLMNRYGVMPVHSLEEMSLLQSRFPDNIRCFVATLNGECLGGVLLYESDCVAHVQYPHATPRGKKLGVIDFINLFLINYYRTSKPHIRYFDFGSSNEDNGRYLNHSLIFYKENFGGRGVTYKTYTIEI